MADYKEGVDFEWVLAKNQPKGGTNKTRRFFSAAEKAALKAPKAASVKAKAATPTKTATGPISGASRSTAGKVSAKSGASRSVAGKVSAKSTVDVAAVAKKGIDKATFKQPRRPISSPRVAGPFTIANTLALNTVTREEYNSMTPEERVAKGLPRTLAGAAIRDESFKASTEAKKPAASTIAQAGKVGRYAKGGMVKKQKGKC